MSFKKKGFIEKHGRDYHVGARGVGECADYAGPVAQVYADEKAGWLIVSTDDYEGTAALNIEALPYLIRALRALQRDLKEAS